MTTGTVNWNGSLEVVLQIPGVGAGASMPGGGGGQLNSPAINDMSNHLRRIAGDTARQGSVFDKSLKQVGIKFNLAAILKQSQIFTSTLGSLFQIFGAAADVFLAAFMPIIVPALRWLASQLPEFRIMVQKVVGTMIDVLIGIKNFGGDTAMTLKHHAAAFLESLGIDGELAFRIVNAQKEAALAATGAGLYGAGAGLGMGGVKKLGARGLQALGVWETIEALRDRDLWQSGEAGAGVAGAIALGKGKGRLGIGLIIGSQIIEYLREMAGLGVTDKTTLGITVNGEAVETIVNEKVTIHDGLMDAELQAVGRRDNK